MESLVRGVILARCLAASERCFAAAARALPSAVSSVAWFFLMDAILSRYSFSDIVSPSSHLAAMVRESTDYFAALPPFGASAAPAVGASPDLGYARVWPSSSSWRFLI